MNFIQVPDEKTPDKASDALNRQIKETEGNRLLSHIRDTDYVIALAIEGKMLDSVRAFLTLDCRRVRSVPGKCEAIVLW